MVQKERKSEGRGLNPLCWLELVKKFLVVVVVCKPILVFSLGFDQAEQLKCILLGFDYLKLLSVILNDAL